MWLIKSVLFCNIILSLYYFCDILFQFGNIIFTISLFTVHFLKKKMPLSIDNLVDGCLLHIFDFLDPFTWVSVAQGKVQN